MQFILCVQWVIKYLKQNMLHVFVGQTDGFDEEYSVTTGVELLWPHKQKENEEENLSKQHCHMVVDCSQN